MYEEEKWYKRGLENKKKILLLLGMNKAKLK